MIQNDSSTARRVFLKTAAATPVILARGKTPAPNILYINSHDSGRYLQPYGHMVPAPNLQRLAESGILFRQAFSAAPTCSPSRAGLVTGQSPHSAGILGLANRGFYIADHKQHVLHTLRTAGYYSALAGIQHIAPSGAALGYDTVLPCRSVWAEHVTPPTVEFLNHAPKQPFWLEVGFFETHRKFHDPGPAEDMRYSMPPAPVPDRPQTRLDWAGFKASARVLDTAVGEILRALEVNGLAGNTLVISTTDHGPAFPTMKCNLTDYGTGVSLIMRGPGGFSGGKVCDAMISHLDLFPTLCDVVGIERPAWLQGHSLMPVIRGEAQEINEEIFAEVTYHAAYEPKRAVRTRRWKYFRYFSGRTVPVLANCDDGPSKTLWLDNGWRNRHVDAEHLYDLMFDPCERHNLAADPELEPILEEMRGRLGRWMRATNDPLLHGPVPAPHGASYNPPDAISPKGPIIRVT